MRIASVLPCLLILSACSSTPSAAGKYNIEQENNAFGEGAEKAILDLRTDKTYDLTMGQLTMFKGTWSETQGVVSLTNGGGNMALSYRSEGNKLIPQKDGKDITFWHFKKQ
jgi:hypothetical protein